MSETMFETAEWREYIAESDPTHRVELLRALASRVVQGQIPELLRRLELEGGDGDEFEACVGLAIVVMQRHSQVLSDVEKGSLKSAALRLLKRIPESIGWQGFYLLRMLDLPAAENFLINEVNPDDLPEPEWKEYLRRLSRLRTERARDRLIQLAKRRDPIGVKAERTLENLWGIIVDKDKLQRIGARWREKREGDDLSWSYYSYITWHLNKPIQEVLDLLGKPTRDGGGRSYHSYHYDSLPAPDGGGMASIYLESDSAGNLKALKML